MLAPSLLFLLLTHLLSVKPIHGQTNDTVSLEEEGSFCTNGTNQSPIDISRYCLKEMRPLRWSGYEHRPEGYALLNSGRTVEVYFEGARPAYIEGGPLTDRYIFWQLHFHWGRTNEIGSEHSIKGKFGSLEAHLVHYKMEYGNVTEALKNEDGLVVTAVIFSLSDEDNKDLKPLISSLEKIATSKSRVILPHDALPWLAEVFSSKNFFTYPGSLTTPSCDEIVTFIVKAQRQKISANQVEAFRQLLDDKGENITSFRREPVQPLNGRKVFRPKCH